MVAEDSLGSAEKTTTYSIDRVAHLLCTHNDRITGVGVRECVKGMRGAEGEEGERRGRERSRVGERRSIEIIKSTGSVNNNSAQDENPIQNVRKQNQSRYNLYRGQHSTYG